MLSTSGLPVKITVREILTSCLKKNISGTVGSRKVKSMPMLFNTTALNRDIPVDFGFSPPLNPNSSVSETSYDLQFKVFNYWI